MNDRHDLVFFTLINASTSNFKSLYVLEGLHKRFGHSVAKLHSSNDDRKIKDVEIRIAVVDMSYVRMGNKYWQERSIKAKKVPRWASENGTHCIFVERNGMVHCFPEYDQAALEIGRWADKKHFSSPASKKEKNTKRKPLPYTRNDEQRVCGPVAQHGNRRSILV